MNSCQLLGRICNDLELKVTPSGISVVSFSIAVDRYMGKDAEKKADFINCVAWRTTAEHICRYWHKGDEILVSGSISTRSYQTKDNRTVYVTEVIIDKADFTHGNKKSEPAGGNNPPPPDQPYGGTQSAPAAQPQLTVPPPPEDDDYPF